MLPNKFVIYQVPPQNLKVCLPPRTTLKFQIQNECWYFELNHDAAKESCYLPGATTESNLIVC